MGTPTGARFWRSKKRTTKKRKRTKKRTVSNFTRNLGFYAGLPRQKVVKLRYSQYGTLTNPGTGALVYQKFIANGIYDPDLTGTGHQPMGYDQMVLQYNHYIVLGSKITVQIIPPQDSSGYACVCGIYLSDDTTLPYTNYTGFIESQKGTYKLMNGATTREQSITSKFSAKGFFAVTDVKDNVDRFGQTVGDNPSEQAIFNLWYQAMDGGAGPTNLLYLATIEYIVQFSEPKDATQS